MDFDQHWYYTEIKFVLQLKNEKYLSRRPWLTNCGVVGSPISSAGSSRWSGAAASYVLIGQFTELADSRSPTGICTGSDCEIVKVQRQGDLPSIL